jgi:outer membrane lipoprotein SlyB
METVGTAGSAHASRKRPGILYPLMLIAAIAVIVFSIVGIATMMGWMPSALSGGDADKDKAASSSSASPGASRSRLAAAPPCDECGVIESIRALPVKGEASGAGAVGGAVIGGILGNQIGRGRGRTAATVVGVGAGAYAGNEIEKNMKDSVTYQIRVRMNDGTIRTLHEPAQPALTIGQKVRVTERGIVAAG